jgi:hypothetical protein
MTSLRQDKVVVTRQGVLPRPHVAKLDRESSRFDRGYAVPATLGLCRVANDVFQPGCLVVVGGGVGGMGPAGLGVRGREALVEKARVFRGNLGAVVGVCGL